MLDPRSRDIAGAFGLNFYSVYYAETLAKVRLIPRPGYLCYVEDNIE